MQTPNANLKMFDESHKFCPSLLFTGESIPTPPQQFTPFDIPSTKLPSAFVTAAMKLFEQGLADPRGCQYQEIEVGTGSCWTGDAGVVKVRGWVLPTPRKDKQHFAICWNGLVYPVVSVGATANVQEDVLKAIQQEFGARCIDGFDFARSEWFSIFERLRLPIKVCLLLRLGEIALAEMFWTTWITKISEDADYRRKNFKDPYLILATEWLWALFDRAVCAHMRGDDKLALLSAELLLPTWPMVEAESKHRGYEYHFSCRDSKESHYLRFLETLPALLLDQQRRAQQLKRQQVLKVGLDKYPDKTNRIHALIEDLEEVFVRQMGQPDYPYLRGHPIVQALIAEGVEAVEPLLACLENDTRLTRTVYFFRDFSRHRKLLSVHEVAYIALTNILKTSFCEKFELTDRLYSQGTEGRQEIAAKIREYLRLNPIRKIFYKLRHRL
ncbi:hypothetical protein [Chlorogloeopsis fritschii]|uniref:hypothetical protein n=1 Tax=Chlorogloeopsis fritschii TaxID=1124 RepID=UPI00370D68F4